MTLPTVRLAKIEGDSSTYLSSHAERRATMGQPSDPGSDDQVQCAIVALDEAMALEKQHGGELVIA